MGKRSEKLVSRSQTLPSSPSHSFSSSTSSDFEFTVSLSPRAATSSSLNPADHLFYKGQLLPLHLSPRLSMVRTLLLSSSSTTSTSSSFAIASRRDSTASSSNDSTISCPSSSRPSSVSDDNINQIFSTTHHHHHQQQQQIKKNKYFSLPKFSSVFNKKHEQEQVNMTTSASSSSVKRISTSAKQVFKKYFKKVKPLYEKLSHKQEEKVVGTGSNIEPEKVEAKKESNSSGLSHSFSGNLMYPRRRRSCVSSCPSSMRSSPRHSGVLSRNGFTSMGMMNTGRVGGMHDPSHLSMEDLQSAIQGAIAHCKSSLVQKKITAVSNEM